MTGVSADRAVQGLEAAGVDTQRVPFEEFRETISELIDGPAVGIELQDLPVSLAETPVTVDPTPAEVRGATVGITPAALCIEDYGSLVLPATADGAELVSLFVEHHVAVLPETATVGTMESAFEGFDATTERARASRILATGPSATADMGALVEGAHGPKRVTAVVLTEG